MMQDITDVLKKCYEFMIEKAKRDFSENCQYEFHPENFETFRVKFKKRCDYVLKEYMHGDVKSLDRHKLSAIAIIELVNSDIVTAKPLTVAEQSSGMINIAPFLFATQAGFQMLLHWLNLDLKGKEALIDKWVEPKLLSCPFNGYFMVFARNLYYTKYRVIDNGCYGTDYNELELAEKLYLFEYITLMNNDIDLELLTHKDPTQG